MTNKVLPKTALISVSNKSGVLTFAKLLQKNGVKIFATGGTASALKGAGIRVSKVHIFLAAFLGKEIRIKLKQKKIISLGLISLSVTYIHLPMLLKIPTPQWMKK
jgi:hypothetical protein